MATQGSIKRHLGITSSTYVSTSDVTIGGNLTVDGTTVTLNTATLDVEDKNILVNKGGTKASADGAGLSIFRGSSSVQSLTWSDASSRFEFSHPLKVDGANGLYLSTGSLTTDSNQLQVNTPHGYGQFGAMNIHHLHIYTDRPSIYTNKPILVQGNTVLTTANTIADDKLPRQVFRTRSTTVGKDTDWDLLIEQGTYGVASSGGAQFEGNNAPPDSDYRYGHVVVTEDTEGQGIRQTYYPHSGKKIFTRTGWNNGSWYSGGWHEHWTSLNHPTSIAGYGITDSFAPTDAEKNVQANWNETNTGSDAFIKNKPTIPSSSNFITTSGGQTITSGGNIGLTIKHDDFNEGLVIHRNHANNSPSITFKNNDEQIGILFGQESDDNIYWRQGTGSTNYKIWHSGDYANKESNWDSAYTYSTVGHLPLTGGTLTGQTTISVGKAGLSALNLRNTENGGAATINFSDQNANPTTQHGTIEFRHADTASYGSGASFTLGSDQSLTVLADGKLMYKDGIYSKPSSGTGAGTRKDNQWDLAYSWGDHKDEQYLTSLPSHNHDDRYYTGTEMRTFFKRGYIESEGAVNLPVGWYTIAINTGDRALGEFQIWDTASSDHQSVIFNASHHFGTDGTNGINVLANSRFSGTNFRYIRIKEAGTYDGAALQVYIDADSNNVGVAIIGGNAQESGWKLVDWIADATDPGVSVSGNSAGGSGSSNWTSFTEKTKVDLDLILNGGILTTGKIYAGSQTEQKEVLLSDTNLFAAASHSHSNYITSNAADTFTGTLTMGTQVALVANNYGRGVFGLYSASKYQHVWGMGSAYKMKDDGSTLGNLYGLAWTHPNNTQGEDIAGLGHQLLCVSNGDTRSAMGDGFWTKYNIQTTSYGSADQWNTAYGWGNHADAGYVNQSAVNASHVDQAKGLSEQGFGVDELTFYQTSSGYANYKSGWAHYIISNHGNGETYYNVTDIRPFWGVPQYSRQEGTQGVWKGPFEYWTEENFTPSSYSNKAASETLTGSKTFSNSYNEFGNGHGSVSNDGSWNARVNIAGSSHARLDVKSVSDGIITTMYAHTGHSAGRVGTYSNHKLDWIISGSPQARLETNGDFKTSGDVVAYFSFSDKSLKTNIKSTENNLEKVLKLNPVSFEWKEKQGETKIGLIAQEVEEVIPEVVEVKERFSEEGGDEYKSVDYEKLVSTLIGAIQEQQKEIDMLKNQIKECHAK